MRNKVIRAVSFAYVIAYVFFNTSVVYASSIQSSKLVTGTKKLFQDALSAVQIIIPVAAVLFIGWQLFKMQSAEDDGDQKVARKRIKVVAVCAIAGEVVSSLVTMILKYYQ